MVKRERTTAPLPPSHTDRTSAVIRPIHSVRPGLGYTLLRRPVRCMPVHVYQPDSDSQAENASSILVTRSSTNSHVRRHISASVGHAVADGTCMAHAMRHGPENRSDRELSPSRSRVRSPWSTPSGRLATAAPGGSAEVVVFSAVRADFTLRPDRSARVRGRSRCYRHGFRSEPIRVGARPDRFSRESMARRS